MTESSHSPVRPRRAAQEGPWLAPSAGAPVRATVRVPGSKSETNRALILAALADGPSTVEGGLLARDTELMMGALRNLGVRIEVQGDRWTITPPEKLHGSGVIECGLAGTVMRFLPPVAALCEGDLVFDGDEQAYARPMGPLLDALYDMGAEVEAGRDSLPFAMSGRPDLPGGPILIDSSSSSQFISGLLLAAPRYRRGIDVRHIGERPVPSKPNIDMTVQMLRDRGVDVVEKPNQWIVLPGPIKAVDQVIEPDLSNAAPFLAAAAITGGRIEVPNWPLQTNQPGDYIRSVLHKFGADVEIIPDDEQRGTLVVSGTNQLKGVNVDLGDCSELTPVVAALASVAQQTSHISGVAHIRGHETDRLKALENELNGLGAHVRQTHDGLVIHPRVLHGGDWSAYADHRMATAGALLGLLVNDVTVDEIGCTAKTMPDFPLLWDQMLADSEDWSDAHEPGHLEDDAVAEVEATEAAAEPTPGRAVEPEPLADDVSFEAEPADEAAEVADEAAEAEPERAAEPQTELTYGTTPSTPYGAPTAPPLPGAGYQPSDSPWARPQ